MLWSGRHDHFTQSVRSLLGTGPCDQPLQSLQRVHYRVSGCSTSRDHVPILYDILYWGVDVSWGGLRGRDVVRSFTEAELRGRTGSLSRSESPFQRARLGSLCLGAYCLVGESRTEPGRFEFHILITACLLSSVNCDFHLKQFVLIVFTVLLKSTQTSLLLSVSLMLNGELGRNYRHERLLSIMCVTHKC